MAKQELERIEVLKGFDALEQEVGRSKIYEAAYEHLRGIRDAEGEGFSLNFGLGFGLFGEPATGPEVVARERG